MRKQKRRKKNERKTKNEEECLSLWSARLVCFVQNDDNRTDSYRTILTQCEMDTNLYNAGKEKKNGRNKGHARGYLFSCLHNLLLLLLLLIK